MLVSRACEVLERDALIPDVAPEAHYQLGGL